MGQRTLGQLLDVDDAAWPYLRDWFGHASNLVEVLSASALARGEALWKPRSAFARRSGRSSTKPAGC